MQISVGTCLLMIGGEYRVYRVGPVWDRSVLLCMKAFKRTLYSRTKAALQCAAFFYHCKNDSHRPTRLSLVCLLSVCPFSSSLSIGVRKCTLDFASGLMPVTGTACPTITQLKAELHFSTCRAKLKATYRAKWSLINNSHSIGDFRLPLIHSFRGK